MKSKILFLLIPALLLAGCGVSEQKNNGNSSGTSQTTSSNNNSGGSDSHPAIEEEYQPETTISDEEKGNPITVEQANSLYNSFNLPNTITAEEAADNIKNAEAVELKQAIKNDKTSMSYKYQYSYLEKFNYFYLKGIYDPILPDDVDPTNYPGKCYSEDWSYNYVREDNYYDLSHEIFRGWLDLTQMDQGIQWEQWDRYHYQKKAADEYEDGDYSFSSLVALEQMLVSSGNTIRTYLSMGDMSSAGVHVEVRSSGPDNLYFYMDALSMMGTVMEARINHNRMEYCYTYTDLLVLAQLSGDMEGMQDLIDSGITKQVSEMSFMDIEASALSYPNEALYETNAQNS